MKKLAFVLIAVTICIVLCALAICALAYILPRDAEVSGRLKIPAHDIRTPVMTAHGAGCDCCPSLWNGGIAHALDDLSPVQVGDTADLTTLDGGHLVMECVEIIPALHVDRWLVSWQGIIQANGDVVIFSAGKAYRFIVL